MRLLREIRNAMGNYHVKSGIYHFFRNEFAQAADFLLRALKDEEHLNAAEGRHARHYLTMALIEWAAKRESEGDCEEGVAHLRRAAEVSPDYPDIHCRMGQLLEKLGRRDEAVEAYEAAIRCNADYLEARVALGFCLIRGGEHEAATKAFRAAMRVKRKKAEAPFRRGIEALERGEGVAASDALHEAFRAAPTVGEEHRRKALDWLKADDHEKALVELDRAIAINPKFPDLQNLRGVVLYELDRVEEAIEAFRLSVGLSPGYLVPRLNLAFALERAGETKQAEVELSAILDLDPTELAATTKLEELRTGRSPDKRGRASRG